jgi:hypothetical protein
LRGVLHLLEIILNINERSNKFIGIINGHLQFLLFLEFRSGDGIVTNSFCKLFLLISELNAQPIDFLIVCLEKSQQNDSLITSEEFIHSKKLHESKVVLLQKIDVDVVIRP